MSTLHVVFRLGTTECVLPAADVLYMESFQGATPVPGAPPFVAGVVQIRGRVVPVVDLRARFGLPALTPTLDSRVVVVKLDERHVGFLVDSAREVVKLDEGQIRPPPRVIDFEGAGFVRAIAQLDARLFMVLDHHKLVTQEHLDGA